ncbi:MAG: DivIVA domain-containing protein [Solirubrobacteraceae bacterium]
MALDRQSIEKKDFPIGRRGYDPEAVDAHLSGLAKELSDFKRSARKRNDTLASSASEHVRAIVEAAEASAADIQRDAETEAREIREEASNAVQATREEATEQAREYIGKVSESTAAMLQRIDAMESELSSLIDTLRTSGNRLDSDLRLLAGNLSEVGEAVSPRHEFELESEGLADAAAPDSLEITDESSSALESDAALVEPGESTGGEPSDTGLGEEGMVVAEEASMVEVGEAEPLPLGDAAAQAESSDDAEGARLIALNMALNGTPRDETAKYLSENFTLADSNGLLDEVYASVEG